MEKAEEKGAEEKGAEEKGAGEKKKERTAATEGKKKKSKEAAEKGQSVGVGKAEKKEASTNKAKRKESKTLASKEPRLLEMYRKEIVPNMLKEGLYNNVMRAPKLTKIVINIGVGKAIDNKKLLDNAIAELSRIAGQKPIKTQAKKSIANFKLREGNAIGCKVTLRGKRMYEFLDRLINASLPRIRDFRGLSSKSFDGRGQYSLGVKEQIIFPEIDYDKIERISGMNITFITTARSDSEAHDMLKRFSFPFRN